MAAVSVKRSIMYNDLGKMVHSLCASSMGHAGCGVTVGTPGTLGRACLQDRWCQDFVLCIDTFWQPLKSEVIGFFAEILEMWIQKLCSCD